MSDNWKQKYFDALEQGEKAEAELQRLATLIRLSVSRLAAPVTGLDEQLDEYLDELRAGVRSTPVSASVEPLLEKITGVVSAMDGTFRTKAAAPKKKTGNVAASSLPPEARLLALLDALDPGLFDAAALSRLRATLSLGLADSGWDSALTDLADLLSEAARSLAKQVSELKGFLSRLTGRLKEIDQSLEGTATHFSENLERGEQMAQAVDSDLGQLTSEMAQATDLISLRDLVELRTETIHSRLHGFIEHERERYVCQAEELGQLRKRVQELELSSSSLSSELDDARQAASRDALTGLANRMAYDLRISAEVSHSHRTAQPLSLVVCDIDHFKKLNDILGHQAGDRVLASVAKVLLSCVRNTDMVARYGGEEFVVLLAGSDAKAARRAAETIRAKVEAARFQFQKKDVSVTLSCGYTQLAGNDDGQTLFERADQFLYQAKSAGRNCVRGGSVAPGIQGGLSRAG